ncbi:MAG: hypothetical protein Fur0015_10510 [Ignavibacteriales bacterium]
MDKNEALKKALEFSKLVKNYLKFDVAALFGSYVNGTPRDDSDIDVAYFINELDEDLDYYSLMIKLNKLTKGIDSRIEPHVFLNDSKSGFLEIVKSNYEIINV